MNCGIKGHGDVPFPSLKPRKFTTITPDSGYLLNRLQKPNNFQASQRGASQQLESESGFIYPELERSGGQRLLL